MKRDMNLVRTIVLALEDSPAGFPPQNFGVEGYSKEVVRYHIYIMMEAGLVRGADVTTRGSKSPEAIATGLTWSGHEFADVARDLKRWQKAMELTKEKAGSITLDVLVRLLTSLVSSALGLQDVGNETLAPFHGLVHPTESAYVQLSKHSSGYCTEPE
jgi:hypothetical protein